MAKKFELGLTMHHETVRALLNRAVISGDMEQSVADIMYANWLKARKELRKRGRLQ